MAHRMGWKTAVNLILYKHRTEMIISYIRIFFSGRVQGVGFRYQTYELAQGYDVAGCVRNLPDGRVELDIEGEPDELRAYVQAIEERMSGFIREREQDSGRREAEMHGFKIGR